MENQHRKIVGYRELTQDDIDLMNRIKKATSDMLTLHAEVQARIAATPPSEHLAIAEPEKWLEVGRTNIQIGAMALIRAVAQPTDC